MSTKKIIICAVIAYLVLTFSLALFDKNDSVVRFVAVGLALVMFILAWFDYEGNMHPLARYNMRAGKLFKKKFFYKCNNCKAINSKFLWCLDNKGKKLYLERRNKA